MRACHLSRESIVRGRGEYGHRIRADLAVLERTPTRRALHVLWRNERKRAKCACAEDRRSPKDNQTVDHSGSDQGSGEMRAPFYEQRTQTGIAQRIECDAKRSRIDHADTECLERRHARFR